MMDFENGEGNTHDQTVPFRRLFSFADSTDILLMAVGTIGALGTGLGFLLMTLLFVQVIDSFGGFQNDPSVVEQVSMVCLNLVYLAIGTGVAAFLQHTCWMVTGERQASRIRGLYLKTTLRQEIAFFDKDTNTGEVIRRISRATVLIQDAMGVKVGKFLQLTTTFIGAFVIAFIKGWLLTIVMLSTFILLVALGVAMPIIIRKMASRSQTAYAKAGHVVEQTIASIRTDASFTGKEHAVSDYRKLLVDAYKAGVHESFIAGIGLGTNVFVNFCGYALAVWFGAKMIMERGYLGSTVINVIIAMLTSSLSLRQASPCMTAFVVGKAAAYKMFETIERKPKIDAYDHDGKILEDIQGEIELREICFSYPTKPEELVLDGFSIHIASGTTTTLVGQSGSGKSTIISLIERFYDPQVGAVLIDGINLKELQVGWIRGKIGLVSQQPVLFASTIKDNIGYGKEGATIEEIKHAYELANAAEFIDKLPQGLDTMVGEYGTQLSSEQKQRIAIARAILKDPKILLLDEATGGLDAESQRVVRDALGNKTMVIVAHCLSAVRDADMIAVIHRGKMVERGRHSELLKDPEGAYSQLIRRHSFGNAPGVVRENLQPEQQAIEVPVRRLAPLNQPGIPPRLDGWSDALGSSFILPIICILISSIIKTCYEPFHVLKGFDFWALMVMGLGLASLQHYSQLTRLQEVNELSEEYESAATSLSRVSSLGSSIYYSAPFSSPIGVLNHEHVDLELNEQALEVPLLRLASLNKQEIPVLLVGCIAAIGTGVILPVCGILTSSVIETFYEPCRELKKESRFCSLMFIVLGLASLLMIPTKAYLFSVVRCKLIQRIRLICFEKVVNMEVGWFDEPENSSGAVGARLSADAASVGVLVGDATGLVVQNIASALAGLIIAFLARWELAFIILVLISVIGVNDYVQMKFAKGFSADTKMMTDEASRFIDDTVKSIRIVASFCAEEKVLEIYREKCEEPMKVWIRKALISGSGFGASFLLLFSAFATCFYAGARLMDAGKATFLDVFQVFFALTMSGIGVFQSRSVAPDFNKAKSASAYIFGIIDKNQM